MYEMISGSTPFKDQDRHSTYKRILKAEYNEINYISEEAK